VTKKKVDAVLEDGGERVCLFRVPLAVLLSMIEERK